MVSHLLYKKKIFYIVLTPSNLKVGLEVPKAFVKLKIEGRRGTNMVK